MNIIGGQEKASEQRKIPNRRPTENQKDNPENTLAITRTLYVKDSIFADEEAPDLENEPESSDRKERNRDYTDRRNVRKQRVVEREKKKRRTVITAVVVAVIAALGIASPFSAGKKEEPEITDIIICSVDDGDLILHRWKSHCGRNRIIGSCILLTGPSPVFLQALNMDNRLNLQTKM